MDIYIEKRKIKKKAGECMDLMIDFLAKGLDGSAQRQKVISNNIANANTPGYKRRDVDFQRILSAELNDTARRTTLKQTDKRHLSGAVNNKSSLFPVKKMGETAYRNDGNSVDIDVEMASLAKNNIYYNTLVRQLNDRFQMINNVLDRS